jgi:hypothetical protein
MIEPKIQKLKLFIKNSELIFGNKKFKDNYNKIIKINFKFFQLIFSFKLITL